MILLKIIANIVKEVGTEVRCILKKRKELKKSEKEQREKEEKKKDNEQKKKEKEERQKAKLNRQKSTVCWPSLNLSGQGNRKNKWRI